MVSSIHLYTETGEAPGRQGGKSEHIGHMQAMSNDAGWDATPVECIDLLNSPHSRTMTNEVVVAGNAIRRRRKGGTLYT